MTEKEKIIQNYMTNLQISREEAEQLFQDDQNDFIGEEGEKMQTSAKKNQHREKSDKPRKAVIKQRKIDNNKKFIFDMVKVLLDTLDYKGKITNLIAKTETELTFQYKDDIYTWKLTKHRKCN